MDKYELNFMPVSLKFSEQVDKWTAVEQFQFLDSFCQMQTCHRVGIQLLLRTGGIKVKAHGREGCAAT